MALRRDRRREIGAFRFPSKFTDPSRDHRTLHNHKQSVIDSARCDSQRMERRHDFWRSCVQIQSNPIPLRNVLVASPTSTFHPESFPCAGNFHPFGGTHLDYAKVALFVFKGTADPSRRKRFPPSKSLNRRNTKTSELGTSAYSLGHSKSSGACLE
jgi:hypothetical protein